jgi:uncharacterized membrane protein
VERLAALRNGLFAVAMTLLALDLKVPTGAIHTDGALLATLGEGALRLVIYLLVIYLMSFLRPGIFWVGQQTQLNFLAATRTKPLVSGVVLTDQTKSIDHAARHVSYIATAPSGLVEAALERVSAIFEV